MDKSTTQNNGNPQLIHLQGMYQDYFLDYASYVILERAVPHIDDGLKPVQRRILHAMKETDDGRYNKVANVIGLTSETDSCVRMTGWLIQSRAGTARSYVASR